MVSYWFIVFSVMIFYYFFVRDYVFQKETLRIDYALILSVALINSLFIF